MQTAKQAIKVTRISDGWAWTLIDGAGGTAARGAALDQQDAMETAWRAARSFVSGSRTSFPDIIVERDRSNR